MSDIVTAYVVFGSQDEAAAIGRQMVKKRLAACVNILGPCQSIYRWDGKIEEAQECSALFKTSTAQSDALIAAIDDMHSYDVPAICVWPIENAPERYRNWVLLETDPNP